MASPATCSTRNQFKQLRRPSVNIVLECGKAFAGLKRCFEKLGSDAAADAHPRACYKLFRAGLYRIPFQLNPHPARTLACSPVLTMFQSPPLAGHAVHILMHDVQILSRITKGPLHTVENVSGQPCYPHTLLRCAAGPPKTHRRQARTCRGSPAGSALAALVHTAPHAPPLGPRSAPCMRCWRSCRWWCRRGCSPRCTCMGTAACRAGASCLHPGTEQRQRGVKGFAQGGG